MAAVAVIGCWGTALVVGAVVWARAARQLRRTPAAAHNTADRRVGRIVWDCAAHKWLHLPPGTAPGPGQMTGRDIAEADQLELLWPSSPDEEPDRNTPFDRLRTAIDEQQEGETP